MIRVESRKAAELADKTAEIERLRNSAEVRLSEEYERAIELADDELRELRQKHRDGARLMQNGITVNVLNEIMKKLDGGEYGCF